MRYLNLTVASALTLTLNCWAVDDANQRDIINQALTNQSHAPTEATSLNEDGGDYAKLTGKQEKYITWRGIANVAGNYLSNANYRTHGGHGSGVFTMSGEAGLHSELGKGWEIDAYVRPEAAFYTHLSEADYWGLSAAIEMQYTPFKGGPQLYFGPQVYRYETFGEGEEISRGVAPYVGARYNYAFQKTRTFPFASYEYTHHFVTPSVDDRDTHAVMLGVTQEIIPKFYAQTYYQFQYSDYENIGRSDLRHIAGAALLYEITQNVIARVGFSYMFNDSSADFATYENFSGGLSSSIRYAF
jgi:hypothetical protein